MLKALFGPATDTSMLRGGLEEASATHKAIAQRVSNALTSSSSVQFADQLAAQTAQGRVDQEDLERDMTSLADTQLRYEADVKLLHAAYQRLRTAIRDRG